MKIASVAQNCQNWHHSEVHFLMLWLVLQTWVSWGLLSRFVNKSKSEKKKLKKHRKTQVLEKVNKMWKVRTSNSLNSTIIFLVHPPKRIKTSQIKSKSEWKNVDKELEKKWNIETYKIWKKWIKCNTNMKSYLLYEMYESLQWVHGFEYVFELWNCCRFSFRADKRNLVIWRKKIKILTKSEIY